MVPNHRWADAEVPRPARQPQYVPDHGSSVPVDVAAPLASQAVGAGGSRVVDADRAVWEECSATRIVLPVQPRRLAKVPFVELADGRLQGVVSSGSDVGRVYVSSIAAGTHAYSCSTNNNRPCGG